MYMKRPSCHMVDILEESVDNVLNVGAYEVEEVEVGEESEDAEDKVGEGKGSRCQGKGAAGNSNRF